jgi:hypothetical protein
MHAHAAVDGYRRSNRATGHLIIWTLAWIATLALARFGPALLWGQQQVAVSWVAVLVNLAVGVGWIIAHMRFLRAVDDLHRKILLDAMAVTLGVGFVVGFGYVVADSAGVVSDVDVTVFPVLLGAVYFIAFLVGRIRYR